MQCNVEKIICHKWYNLEWDGEKKQTRNHEQSCQVEFQCRKGDTRLITKKKVTGIISNAFKLPLSLARVLYVTKRIHKHSLSLLYISALYLQLTFSSNSLLPNASKCICYCFSQLELRAARSWCWNGWKRRWSKLCHCFLQICNQNLHISDGESYSSTGSGQFVAFQILQNYIFTTAAKGERYCKNIWKIIGFHSCFLITISSFFLHTFQNSHNCLWIMMKSQLSKSGNTNK